MENFCEKKPAACRPYFFFRTAETKREKGEFT